MQISTPKLLKDIAIIRSTLQQYHPLVIEGHGSSRDKRNPSLVSQRIIQSLHQRWNPNSNSVAKNHRINNRPVLLISQGDPLEPTGISAITNKVAQDLGIYRCLITLDEDIDPEHSIKADRQNVQYELKYSRLIELINEEDERLVPRLENAIDLELISMNERKRKHHDEDIENSNSIDNGHDKKQFRPIADWYKDYAMLQEVTKSAMKIASGGELTLVHTVEEISDFSVTYFYRVGLDLGLVDMDDVVSYTA